MTPAMNDAMKNIFKRWGCGVYPEMDREQCGKVFAISVGLGAIFNENSAAEKTWMRMRMKMPTWECTPLTAVLSGQLDRVLDEVNKERGLS